MGRGRTAEELISWTNARLSFEGRAWIRKAEAPAGMRRGGNAYFKAAGPPDYQGVLAGGRAIVFELKSTEAAAFAWPDRQGRGGRTKARQLADLAEAGGLGALCGLLIAFTAPLRRGAVPTFAWVPWQRIPAIAQGRWSLERLLGEGGAIPVEWPAAGDPDYLTAAGLAEIGADPIVRDALAEAEEPRRSVWNRASWT